MLDLEIVYFRSSDGRTCVAIYLRRVFDFVDSSRIGDALM